MNIILKCICFNNLIAIFSVVYLIILIGDFDPEGDGNMAIAQSPPVATIKSQLDTRMLEPTNIKFVNSCSPEVQADFNYGITLLHSFEYPEAKRIFSRIALADPDCAMARWGEAMSYWHPLWAPPSKDDLTHGLALLNEAEALVEGKRETAYIDALKIFYSGTEQKGHRKRVLMFEEKMKSLHAEYPDDIEATVFYALALRATANPHDKTYAIQHQAGSILKKVGEKYPTYPGILHYILHSYDYPGLAELALDEAKIYAQVASNSTHAQHMPSHIFTRLGLWDSSIVSNHDSIRSAEAYTKSANLPGLYDEALHSIDYLMYALLQTGRDKEASELLLRLNSLEKAHPENFKVAFTYASSPARYALERRQWVEASNLELSHPEFLWNNFLWAKSIHYFARGIGAARSGQTERALEDLKVLKQIQNDLPVTTLPYWREEVGVHINAVSAWIEFANGNLVDALVLAETAADTEDAVDKHPVTPGEILPARELLGDLLLEVNRHEAALAAYNKVLKGSPNRLNALLGAARSARGMGNEDVADIFLKAIKAQVQNGERLIVGLK
jgi:tetratricopeptide (TPR) repeat protein